MEVTFICLKTKQSFLFIFSLLIESIFHDRDLVLSFFILEGQQATINFTFQLEPCLSLVHIMCQYSREQSHITRIIRPALHTSAHIITSSHRYNCFFFSFFVMHLYFIAKETDYQSEHSIPKGFKQNIKGGPHKHIDNYKTGTAFIQRQLAHASFLFIPDQTDYGTIITNSLTTTKLSPRLCTISLLFNPLLR